MKQKNKKLTLGFPKLQFKKRYELGIGAPKPYGLTSWVAVGIDDKNDAPQEIKWPKEFWSMRFSKVKPKYKLVLIKCD